LYSQLKKEGFISIKKHGARAIIAKFISNSHFEHQQAKGAMNKKEFTLHYYNLLNEKLKLSDSGWTFDRAYFYVRTVRSLK